MIKFQNTLIDDCKIIECDRFYDERGQFQELYQLDKYEQLFGELKWKQANWSVSKKNVLRGIHLANYDKLVTCISGKIWDFVVDFRINSPTFLKHFGIKLSCEESKQIFVPKGCGHGFISYEDNTSVVYLQTDTFAYAGEKTIKYSDPSLSIDYPGIKWIVSERDQNAISVDELLKTLN
jgi:dTDP-4-dehydrorhamnose 3,5-epimerase